MNDQNTLYQDYSKTCADTAIYPKASELQYLALGLCSEVAELQEVIMFAQRRTALRSGETNPTLDTMRSLLREAGDAMWYSARLADFLGETFSALVEGAKWELANTNAPLALLGDCVSAMSMEAGLIAGRTKKELRDGSNWPFEDTCHNRGQIHSYLIRLVAATLGLTAAIVRIGNVKDGDGMDVFDRMLKENMIKVLGRKERGTTGGDGEHR